MSKLELPNFLRLDVMEFLNKWMRMTLLGTLVGPLYVEISRLTKQKKISQKKLD